MIFEKIYVWLSSLPWRWLREADLREKQRWHDQLERFERNGCD